MVKNLSEGLDNRRCGNPHSTHPERSRRERANERLRKFLGLALKAVRARAKMAAASITVKANLIIKTSPPT